MNIFILWAHRKLLKPIGTKLEDPEVPPLIGRVNAQFQAFCYVPCFNLFGCVI
jgi:hypothetical protein